MTTTTTTTWQLVGITTGEATCDHCGRTLARCFRVVTPDGDEMTVGRVCSAKLTGYNWKLAQAERAERLRAAEEAAATRYGQLYADLTAQHELEGRRLGMGSHAAQGRIALRDRKAWQDEAETLAYARDMLAESVARWGRAA
jgi:hypothetical protein